MTAPVDKIIVTNLAKLSMKYGAGASHVKSAVKKLIGADGARGLISRLVDVSDPAEMAPLGVPPISAADAGSAKRNKAAIDAICTHDDLRPSYVLLLGSTDVVPHVPLKNPVMGDGDPDVPSDLPYACEKPYGTNVQDFLAPTRVVGRLPNVTNDTDADYLVNLLDTAINYKQRAVGEYNKFLGISADVWKKSTALSLDALFSTHAGMKISPPDGYKWTSAEAKRLGQFVNLHGASGDPHFYGQKGGNYPVAHSAAWMDGKIAEGTVMAAECCYGVELYDPAIPTALGQRGMCNTYLANKAYAFFGSTNIAYGPAAANDQADLICRYFGTEVGNGASIGRACLQARLDYVLNKGGLLGPTDLKTLAQFNLMGDPSLTPVAAPEHSIALATRAATAKTAIVAVPRHARLNRRAGLLDQAAAVTTYRLVEGKEPTAKNATIAKLRKLAAENGIKSPDMIAIYSIGNVQRPLGGKSLAARDTAVAGPGPVSVSIIFERLPPPDRLPHLALIRGVQAIEYNDGMDARLFESR